MIKETAYESREKTSRLIYRLIIRAALFTDLSVAIYSRGSNIAEITGNMRVESSDFNNVALYQALPYLQRVDSHIAFWQQRC